MDMDDVPIWEKPIPVWDLHGRGRMICALMWYHNIDAGYFISHNQLYIVVNDRTVLGHVRDMVDDDGDPIHVWEHVVPCVRSLRQRELGGRLKFRPLK